MSIEIKFDAHQAYQREAIDSIVEVFAGQESVEQGISLSGFGEEGTFEGFDEMVFGNTLSLAPETVRRNLRRVQDREVDLEDGSVVPAISESLRRDLEDGEMPDEFSVEMETGTGKTYVYLRTIAELHQKYGFKKFVIVVPSVAIREGVLDSLRLLKEHIRDVYDGLQYDSHVYDSKSLGRVRQFATTSHLQIMVINIDTLVGNESNRIIHRPTDAMNGYAPIEFLRACRPVVIMDEPQSLDGPTHKPAIDDLCPLFRVGYSATPPTDKSGLPKAHLVHRLTPVDAYNQRLVKRIGVLSIEKDPDFNEPYVEVKKITASSADVTATVRMHVAGRQGKTKEVNKTIRKDDDLFQISGRRDVYQGWTVEDIHAGDLQLVEFGNGRKVEVGHSTSEADDQQMRLMLRQAIESHFEKELQLMLALRKGVIPAAIKPLTLFFIERVAHYAPDDAKLRQWFEEEYEDVRSLGKFRNLTMPDVADVHDGYFAQTKKGEAKDAKANTSYAATAFERIVQNKEDLLSFDEPLRFIFSHSALAEGWDNPNVFTICNLQDGKSTMRRRQQVGRGLRLPVMANGERCHDDDINLLTVVAKVGFAQFADQLQKEIEEDTGTTFTGRIVNIRKDKKTVKLNEQVLDSPEFRELWEQISPRTTYRVDFSTAAVVAEAVRRINDMAAVEPVKFRVSKDVVAMDSEAVKGADSRDRGDVVAASHGKLPDIVGELTRRLMLSRATVVRILRESDRLGDVRTNPAVFLDQVTEAINAALYQELAKGIVYRPSGDRWSMELIRERHNEESIAPRVVPVSKSITDHVICDSEVEQRFAEYLDERDDVPLFVKLPDWFKITTPLGNYNPDWALVRKEAGGNHLYLVRETKGTDKIEQLQWESEGWKIKFGRAHFNALRVDYHFGHDPNVLVELSPDFVDSSSSA